MSWITNAPTVTAHAKAAAPTIWPAVRARSVRRCSSARSTGSNTVSSEAALTSKSRGSVPVGRRGRSRATSQELGSVHVERPSVGLAVASGERAERRPSPAAPQPREPALVQPATWADPAPRPDRSRIHNEHPHGQSGQPHHASVQHRFVAESHTRGQDATAARAHDVHETKHARHPPPADHPIAPP
jgi:hypothetical protein